jgi:hypothetical protein
MVMAIGPATMPLYAGAEPYGGLFSGRKGAGPGCLEHRLKDRLHLPWNPRFLQEGLCLRSIVQPVNLKHGSSTGRWAGRRRQDRTRLAIRWSVVMVRPESFQTEVKTRASRMLRSA